MYLKLKGIRIIIYLDDILIMGETYDEHMDWLMRVLKTLEAHGVKVKAER